MRHASARIALFGASAGGIEALSDIFRRLDRSTAVPVVAVLHTHPDTPGLLSLFADAALPVLEVTDGMQPAPGTINIAPPDYHVLFEEDRSLSLQVFERIKHARPAVDPLFMSAAAVYGPAAAGFILSGANNDGARGLRVLADAGGFAAVQSPEEASVPSMPLYALQEVPDAFPLRTDAIALLVSQMMRLPL